MSNRFNPAHYDARRPINNNKKKKQFCQFTKITKFQCLPNHIKVFLGITYTSYYYDTFLNFNNI